MPRLRSLLRIKLLDLACASKPLPFRFDKGNRRLPLHRSHGDAEEDHESVFGGLGQAV
jgi:hypothetical protein